MAFVTELISRMLTISGLGVYTSYTVRVSASTSAGEGPQSAPTTVFTDEEGRSLALPLLLRNFMEPCSQNAKRNVMFTQIYRREMPYIYKHSSLQESCSSGEVMFCQNCNHFPPPSQGTTFLLRNT